MPSRTRRRATAASLLLAVPGLAACGFDVQTDQPYQPGVGSNASEGSMNVLGATVVVEGEEAADQGTLSVGLVNGDLEDGVALSSVTGEDVEVTLLEPIEVGPDDILNTATTGAISVAGDLAPGGYVRLTFVFDNGDEVPINVPVVNDLEEFADVVPAEPESSPSPSESPTPGEPVETPTSGPSSDPSPSEG